MISATRVWMVVSPLVLFVGAHFGAPLVAEVAPTTFVIMVAVASFVLAAGLTWALARAEGIVTPRTSDHFRQASLLYLLAGINVISPLFRSAEISCFVCPPPWVAIVVPALGGNILVLALHRGRPFAA